MTNLNLVKLTSSLMIAFTCFMFSSASNASPSVIDSALNSSLKETSELSGAISGILESKKSIDESRMAMQKNRNVVQLNMEDAEGERSSAQSDQPQGQSSEQTQASGSLVESSY
jgi:hypothetical protein